MTHVREFITFKIFKRSQSVEVKFVWQISRPTVNCASLDRFLNGPFVKTGCCQVTQNRPIPKKNFCPIPWQAAEIIGGLLAKESQSYRHPRVLSIRVGENFSCLISINSLLTSLAGG